MKRGPGTRPVLSRPAAALLQSLRERLNRHAALLARCRIERDEKTVHDLRVSLRRLISVLTVARVLMPRSGMGKAGRLFRGELKLLRKLRDIHVNRLIVEGMLAEFRQLDPLHDALMLNEREEAKGARRRLLKFQPPRARELIRAVEERLRDESALDAAGGNLLAAAREEVGKAWKRLLKQRGARTPEDAKSLHKLRIAFKKYRYMVEALRSVLPGVTPDLLEGMRDFQHALGEVQDIAVVRETLSDFALKKKLMRLEDFKPVSERLALRQRNAQRTAVAGVVKIDALRVIS